MRLETFDDEPIRKTSTPADIPAAREMAPDDTPEAALADRLAAALDALAKAEARAEALERDAGAIAQLAASFEAAVEEFRAAAERRLAVWETALADAGRACLPMFSEAGFHADAARAAVAIARRGGHGEIGLRMSPEDLEPMAAAIAPLAGEHGFALKADHALRRGRILLDWPEGGARIDSRPLFEAALAVFDHQFGNPAPEEALDDGH